MSISEHDRETILKFLLTRRSIRKFKPNPIDMETVKRILDIARYAPSAGNRQPWIFIIITDKEIKSKLAAVHPWAYPLNDAPMGIVVACDKNASPDSYHVDCANATIYLMLAAHALGLGTVWLQTLKNIEDIQKILNLPSSYIPISMIALGYPAESPQLKPRKSLSDITYIDSYGNRLK
ncbi:MAG: nitroreductase family protein [Ignisphaera sp.]|uniref:Nitroreductase family protein n=1 Tax=Ignisphaera aggregans TaxID=334771 RepID=A0A7J3MYV0_9CREN